MKNWGVEMKPLGTVGTKTVRATVRGTKGVVTLSGVDEAVDELLKDLTEEKASDFLQCAVADLASSLAEETARDPETLLTRFVFVDSDGRFSAMAFEFNTPEISLRQIEEVENFASQKLEQSQIAVRWDVLPNEKTDVLESEPGVEKK